MYAGRIVGIVGPETSREALGLMMAGVPADEALEATSGKASTEGAGKPADDAEPAATSADSADDDSATTSAEETK